MTELAEQAQTQANERPDGLPENFKSVDALVTSYRQSQRKITELAREKSELEQMIASSETPDPADETFWQYGADPYGQGVDEQPDELVANQIHPAQLAALAQQAVTDTVIGPRVAGLVAAAEQMLQADYPGYPAQREQVAAMLQQNPHLIDHAVGTGNAAELAGILANAYQSVEAQSGPSTQELMRTMKINAQSATGAGGRPQALTDAAQRWQEIAGASDGKLNL